MSPAQAVQQPIFEGSPGQEIAAPGVFSEKVLAEAQDEGTVIRESTDSLFPSWVAITVNKEGGLSGATDSWLEPIGGGVGSF